jgi:regulator of sigma E protease
VDDHTGDPRPPRDWDPNALAPFGPRPVPEHRWFESKKLPARLFILLAGVTMNVVLAILVYTGAFATYGRPYVPAVVDSVVAGRPAALAGIAKGDSIAAVNGEPVRTWADVIERVSPVTSGTVTLDLVRAGARRQVVLEPKAEDAPDPVTGSKRRVGRVGIAPRDTVLRQPLGLADAAREGWNATWVSVGGVVTVVKGLFTRQVSVTNLGGPIAIARTSVAAAKSGLESLLHLIAFLSVNLAVLNLLPIPVLDGGQVLINVLEAAKGSAFSTRTREYILRAGLAAIALLFVTVMWNDIARWAGDLLGK